MSATISVVVPTYNSESVIGQCLESLNNQTYPPENVVVCDGGSTDQTVAIATSYGATIVQCVANRSAQRNVGAMRALGEYIVFVDADMRLTTGVLEDCVTTFAKPDAALVIPEVDIGESYWARVRGFERTFYKRVWWLQAARCYRKTQFLELGGFDVGLIGAEDWDLDERIRQFGRIRKSSATIEHDEAHTNFSKLMKKKTHYSQSLQAFEKKHPERAAMCLSCSRRAWLFVRRPGRLIAHPVLTAGMTAMGTLEILVSRGRLKRWTNRVEESPLDSTRNPLLNGDSK